MSKHHAAQKWSTHSPKLRAQITPLLPLSCIECGRPVTADQKWHVGHRQDAAKGGRPTAANAGPAHAGCNLTSGGRAGAAVTNARRRAKVQPDIRDWLR